MNLDFSEKKVQAISLDALRMTITEKYPNGNPVGGIYHYQLIDQLLSWLKDVGYEAEVTDLFAANNRDKYRPGVTFDPAAADKFGDNGITGCIMVNGDTIDTFLLSCRILGKGIELAFAKKILSMLKDSGLETVKAEYIPTAKNAQVKDFYEKCGFPCVKEEVDGKKSYVLDLKDADLEIEKYYHINLK